MYGVSHAIDFVGVDARGRSAPRRWQSVLSPEPPDFFVGFGRPILAPIAGTVVETHDEQADHVGRRSQLTLLPYMLGQSARVRAGVDAMAGNRVVIAVDAGGPFVVLAHLREGSLLVTAGEKVNPGQQVGACGNSGNSTEPHLHLQVSDTTDWPRAAGLPLTFRRGDGTICVPEEGEIVVAEDPAGGQSKSS